MTGNIASDANPASPTLNFDRVGFYAAVLTTVITIITFGFALLAIPISGANCPENCVTYPYLDTVSQFPRDFLWMLPAMVLLLVYVTLMTAIHAYAPAQKKAFSQIGVAFALISAVILLIDYYVQFSVVPVSLMNDETQGLPLLIQYNPHGIFIALEELGYIMMSLSFLMVAPAFAGAIRWVFILSFGVVVVAFVGISFAFGLERLDRFEVVVISVNWLVLIINGVLLGRLFRRRLNANI
jgi:hypothetical protein